MGKINKRNQKEPKKLIYVFCEGESEIQYIRYFKQVFDKRIVLKPEKGLIPSLKTMFKPSAQHEGEESEISEIWFFFDIEEIDKKNHWPAWKKTLIDFSKSRKTSKIKIRLLMTTACVEYWFLLHYKRSRPVIESKHDKEIILNELSKIVPGYKKADNTTIWEIASNYKTALENGKWVLQQIPEYERISGNNLFERESWLFMCSYTFTTVHEAIAYLEEIYDNE